MKLNLKTELPRMKGMMLTIKKLEAISPLQEAQLFYADTSDSKLHVYGYGAGALGASRIEAAFDCTDLEDDFYFTMPLSSLINFLDGGRMGDEVAIDLNQGTGELLIKSTSGKRLQIKQVVLATEDCEIPGIRSGISDFLAAHSADLTELTGLDACHKELDIAASLLGLLNTNQFLMTGNTGTSIKMTDDCAIISFSSKGAVLPANLPIHRLTSSLLLSLSNGSKVSAFTDMKNVTWFYVDEAGTGIRLYFAQEPVTLQCPTDEEVTAISPTAEEHVKVAVETSELYRALDEFDKIFQASSWQYKQIYFNGAPADGEWALHFDDMVTSADTKLPFTLEECVGSSEQAETPSLLIPFLHLAKLRPFLDGHTLHLTFSVEPDRSVIEINVESDSFDGNLIITKLQS